MAIDKYLDGMDELLEEALVLPLTGGRRMVNVEKARELLDNIRLNLPREFKEAKAIVADRELIISEAKAEAEQIVKKAEDRARAMVQEEEVFKTAQAKAGEIMTEAHQKSRSTERAALEFSEETLKRTEAALLAAYNDLKTARQALRGSKGQQN